MSHSDETPRAANVESQSTISLLRDALTNVSTLVRSEVELARAEVSENMNKAVGALISIAVALVFAIVALNTISAALVGLLSNITGLGAGVSSLIVAVVFAIIAFIFLSKGKSDLKARSLAPTRTVTNVRRDAETVKEATK